MAGADVNGTIRLVVSPAVMVDAPCKKVLYTHPCIYTRLPMEDQFLMSMGKDDRCLMQWKYIKSSVAPVSTVVADTEPKEPASLAAGTFAESYKGIENLIPAADTNSAINGKLNIKITKGTSQRPFYCGNGNIITTSGKSRLCVMMIVSASHTGLDLLRLM